MLERETSSIAEASCMGDGATVRRGSYGYVLPLDTGALRRPHEGRKQQTDTVIF